MNLKMKNYFFVLLSVAFFVGCSNDNTSTALRDDDTTLKDDKKILKASAKIMAKSNSEVSGEVTFTQADGKVIMNANLSGLTPGKHAIHIHAKGDCSADDGTSAGGHWNPTHVDHGKWGTDLFHIGDIGNITADANGDASISRATDLWCINCDDEIKNIIGKSIIIHAGPDDFTSQPSGAAGARIGCGEIIAQ